MLGVVVEERRREAKGVRQRGGRCLVGRRRRGWIRSAAEAGTCERRIHRVVDPDDHSRTSSQSQDQVISVTIRYDTDYRALKRREKARSETKKRTRNLSGRIDLHTHASSTFDNRVTLTFDLLTLGLSLIHI